MPLNPRYVLIAAGAAVAGAFLVLRNSQRQRRAVAPNRPAAATHPTHPTHDAPAGSLRELSQFLAGESWFDELGWQGIWQREGIDTPEGWLRTKGRDVLATERTKLTEHPALLAGCRRRWIVVCRYAGIEVKDAASLWNGTERAAA